MFGLWKVIFLSKYGEDAISVKATNRLTAITLAGVDISHVIAVRREWNWYKQLKKWASKVSENEQLTILLNIQANCLIGDFNKMVSASHVNRSFSKLAKQYPEAMREDIELSRKMTLLQFEPAVCAAIENGEKTGNLVLGIEEAIHYLKCMMNLRSKTSHQMKLSAIMLLVSIGILFFFPLSLKDALIPLLEVEEINFPKTLATDILLFMGEVIDGNVILIFLLLLFLIGACLFYYPKLKTFFPFSLFNELSKSRRSIRFLAGWMLYRLSGIVMETDRRALCRVLGDEISGEICNRLEHGESLSDVITHQHFSLMLVDVIYALCQFDTQRFKNVSDLLIKNLVEEQTQKAKLIANFFYFISMVISLIIIFLLAYGFIFPMLGSVSGIQL